MNVSVKTTFESKDAIVITFLKGSQMILLSINGTEALLTAHEMQQLTNLLSLIKPVDKK
jgi:hypothetical protein